MLISRGSKCCLIQRKEPCPTFGRMLTTTLSEMNVVVCQLLFGRQVVSNSVIPWTVSRQAPLSMGFPRQKYLSGLPFPPPRDLPNPGIEPMSPALVGEFFTTEPPRKPWYVNYTSVKKQKTHPVTFLPWGSVHTLTCLLEQEETKEEAWRRKILVNISEILLIHTSDNI